MTIQSTKVCVFQSLQLFREDLDEVVKIFRVSIPESTVSLEDGERTYESFEQMRTLNGDEASHLIFQNQEIGIKLDLQKRVNGLTLTTLKRSDEAELAFYRARDYLRPKTRPGFTAWQMLPILCVGSLFLSGPWLYQHRNENVGANALGALALIAIASTIITLSNKILARTCMFVTLKRRHEYPPFVKRNRDSLMIMVIGTAIGIAATLLIQHLRK